MAGITLNQAERRELIHALVTNCAGWDAEDIDLLVNMDPAKLYAHAKNCAQLVANAEPEDDSGIPERMKPESADSHEGDADEAWDEEEDRDGDQGEEVTDDVQDEDLDQPTDEEDREKENVAGSVTENEWLVKAPPRIRSVVTNALKFEHQQKVNLVGTITANSRNRFSERYLMRMGIDELQALADLAAPRRNYMAAAGGPTLNEANIDRDDILTVPVIEFARA